MTTTQNKKKIEGCARPKLLVKLRWNGPDICFKQHIMIDTSKGKQNKRKQKKTKKKKNIFTFYLFTFTTQSLLPSLTIFSHFWGKNTI